MTIFMRAHRPGPSRHALFLAVAEGSVMSHDLQEEFEALLKFVGRDSDAARSLAMPDPRDDALSNLTSLLHESQKSLEKCKTDLERCKSAHNSCLVTEFGAGVMNVMRFLYIKYDDTQDQFVVFRLAETAALMWIITRRIHNVPAWLSRHAVTVLNLGKFHRIVVFLFFLAYVMQIHELVDLRTACDEGVNYMTSELDKIGVNAPEEYRLSLGKICDASNLSAISSNIQLFIKEYNLCIYHLQYKLFETLLPELFSEIPTDDDARIALMKNAAEIMYVKFTRVLKKALKSTGEGIIGLGNTIPDEAGKIATVSDDTNSAERQYANMVYRLLGWQNNVG